MQAFADQAAIAVANAKLFNDLDAALERQTAMTDVLDAVSTAHLDLHPVFDRHRPPRRSALRTTRFGDHVAATARVFIVAVAGATSRVDRPAPAVPARRNDGHGRRNPARRTRSTSRVDRRLGSPTNYPNSPALAQTGTSQRARRADEAAIASVLGSIGSSGRSRWSTATRRSHSSSRSPTRPRSPSTTHDSSARSRNATATCPSRSNSRRRRATS